MEKFYAQLSAEFGRLLAALAGQKIAVIGHARPDGDCIGSQVALARVLAARGFDVVCVNPDPVPRRLQFLVPGMTFLRTDDELASREERAAIPAANGQSVPAPPGLGGDPIDDGPADGRRLNGAHFVSDDLDGDDLDGNDLGDEGLDDDEFDAELEVGLADELITTPGSDASDPTGGQRRTGRDDLA